MSAATPEAKPRPVSTGAHSCREAWLAWLTLFISCVLTAASAFYLYRNRAAGIESNDYWVANAAISVIYPLVGAIIISRRPRHIIGWLFCVTGILNAIVVFGSEYGAYGLASGHETLPGAIFSAWLNHWLWVPAAVPVILLILLFPEGRPPSPRWLGAAWAGLVGTVLLSLSVAFIPGPLTIANIDNPYALANATDLLGVLALIGGVCLLAAMMASLASLIVKGRRAQGMESQQLEWFVYAGIVAIALFFGGVIADQLTNRTFFSPLANTVAFPLIPAAVGIAILRYRLYEIDLLINRTLVYVPLTAILAGIFAASISLSQKFFIAITGASSDAATVLTTLVVVAAFEPLKSGLQHLVDRRFKQPEKKFGPLGNQVRTVLQVIDLNEITKRLLDDAVKTFDAACGAVYLKSDGQLHLIRQVGEWNGEARLSVPLQAEGEPLGMIALGPRLHGSEYTPDDRQALQEIGALVARAIALADRKNGVRA